MRKLLPVLILLLMVGLCGCRAPEGSPSEGRAVIFLLDSEVNRDFLAGRVLGLRAADVSHGSLVGRVIRSYCRAELISVPVESLEGAVDHGRYLQGLRGVLDYARTHPNVRVVVNVSLSSTERDPIEAELLRRLDAADVLVVAAAGNEDSEEPFYPAAFPETVAVASATAEGKALHSNYGPYVDIAASGDISFIDYDFLPYEKLRREMGARGTSFAAPKVAATVAFLLERRADLSPRQAYRMVEERARPIVGEHFRQGLLGAGLLDVRRAKAAVAPGYHFAHYVLPVCVWVVLGVLSVYLCVRHGLVGMFLTLMTWLVALPASFFSVVQMGRWLDFVGRGDLVVGSGAAALLCAGWSVALAVQDWIPLKAVAATLLPYGVFLVLAGGGDAGPVVLASAAAVAAVLIAGGWERVTQKRLASIRSTRSVGSKAARRLLRTKRLSVDPRIQKAVIEKLGAISAEEAVRPLLRESRLPEEARAALAQTVRGNPESLRETLRQFDSLPRRQRNRLCTVLREEWSPELERLLEEVVAERGSARLRNRVEELRAGRGEGTSPTSFTRKRRTLL